ncbi:hypothetical protein BXZ70DRAFT_912866 [Cristinia sonorae]|uniref:Conidiation-specific protein 6 n=1 Tax=Cristinia sonorae TaxID=1940300 RepID=A0A8K0V1J5_9AGAR|nr:hypothetical protein BXZ70DRAFT_912866 [Cristinia sonorae]
MASENKDPTRVAAGLKATIHNPNVSEDAKERAAERLERMGQSQETTHATHATTQADSGESNRVLGGYKATLSNPNTSEQAKAHAREILEAAGYTFERSSDVSEDEHQTRVLAGYKAALHNPRVSQEAKDHAKEYLREHNAL